MSAATAIEWHTGADALTAEWDALADRTGATPFQRPGWIAAWHEAFGKPQLAIAALRHGGRLVAVLPIQRSRKGLISTTNWHTPVFGPVAEDGEAVAQITRALFADRVRRVSMLFVDGRDPFRSVLHDRAAAVGYRTVDASLLRSPYLDLEGDWEGLWRSLGSKRRNGLKRKRHRLERRGDINLRILDDWEGVRSHLDDAFRIEALGWKGERGTAIASEPETQAFYRGVASWAAGRGSFRLALLEVAGRPVAFDYALEEGGRHYLIKTGFDPEYRDCAPGITLRAMMIERACSLGLQRYEFLGGPDQYKLEWTDTAHDRRRIHAFAPSPVGLAAWAVRRYGRPLARRVLGRDGE